MNHSARVLAPVLVAALLLADSVYAFRVLVNFTAIQLTFTHQLITLVAVKNLPLSACPASSLADYVAGVDFSENHIDIRLSPKPGTPNQLYNGTHHFDRKPGQNHLAALSDSTQYFQTLMQGSERAFRNGDTSTGMQLLGLALHAIQDLIAHSNLVDELSAGQQAAVINAVLTGNLGSVPLDLRLMYYDPASPHLHDNEVPLGYTHEDNAKDDVSSAFHIAAGTKAIEVSQMVISSIVQRVGPSFCPDPPGFPITPGASFDPNDKLGPIGVGLSHYFSGEEPLRYSILFENKPTATLPAQEVIVRDQLDPNTMDLSTFSLGLIWFGNKHTIPPPGTSSFAATIDLRPATNLLVKIDVSVGASTGLLIAKFSSLDPTTGNPPLDPSLGFLPPNTSPPQGEGGVFFTVQPKKLLASGTAIRNQAQIFFDANPAIVTPEWLNVIDLDKPSSHVSPLPTTQSAVTFLVQWSGADGGAGMGTYTVFVSDNGSPFTDWQSNTAATSASYTGQSGHTYGFFSVARDLVGNTENAKSTAETSTQVVLSSCAANGTSSVTTTPSGLRRIASTGRWVQTVAVSNSGTTALLGPISLVLDGLSTNANLFSPTGTTGCASPLGSPYVNANLGTINALNPGQTVNLTLEFVNPSNQGINYTRRVLLGPGSH